ncbi:MAG: alpha/beta hydrolase [Desulfobacterales bacterium]|nr:alpha/beta hydrolase [Desulfobacterales bacterium]
MIQRISELSTPNGPLHLTSWSPDNKPPSAVMVIAHGMAEHAARYTEFAEKLTQKGFSIYADDHRGHGRSVPPNGVFGHFADKGGWNIALSDLKALMVHAAQSHPGLPLFLFGHSMGSFLVRDFISSCPHTSQTLSGVIISGTADIPGIVATACHLLAKSQAALLGPQTPSYLMDRLTFGLYNLCFRSTRTAFDWLCSNPESVDRYIQDPLCGYVSTAAFFKDMGYGLMRISRGSHIKKTPAQLPLLFLAGTQDPVASFGLAIHRLTKRYRKTGCSEVTSILYPKARHELFGEFQKETVYTDILSWISPFITSDTQTK